jgi:uncharacterized protein YbjT (DUF2867 family)
VNEQESVNTCEEAAGVARRVFLTGATGYVGGRLAPELLLRGHAVRCLSRSPRKLEGRPWTDPLAFRLADDDEIIERSDGAASFEADQLDIVEGDLSDEEILASQMRGCDVAYYLIHSMGSTTESYRDRDRRLATTFTRAARRAGVRRIIYLGGLGEMGEDLSEHLRSRREVEGVLRHGADDMTEGEPAQVTVLRAAMIIGSGSASFEILRYLVERLPAMITPRWVRTECQPIAIRNVLHYLATCLDTPETVGRTLDIGGPDVLTYHDLMRITEQERGLSRRLIVPIPVLTPKLSSYWLHLTTPVTASVARPLAEGLRNRVVCRNDEAAKLMPQRLLDAREAIGRAIENVSLRRVETSWSAAGVVPGDPDWAGGTVFRDKRDRCVDASPADTFAAICKLGGGHGWYAVNWLWRIRGLMDQLVGGPGLRRGRRDPENLRYGDALDFWRVIGLERDRRLTLLAEMKVPGVAQLEFRIEPDSDAHEGDAANQQAGCTLTQEAKFQPKGLLGLAYWYAVLPAHGFVFSGMLRGIATEAENMRLEREGQRGPDAETA